MDDPGSLKFPPDDYRFITLDVWNDFVKSRLTAEFLEKHEKHRERHLQNEYNHSLKTLEHTGRVRGVGGYVLAQISTSLPKRRKQSVTQSTRLSVRQIMFEEQKKMEEQLKEKIAAEERAKLMAEEREKIVAEENEKLTKEIREKILKEET
ncbi:hypothetical protein ACLB2K_046850 [Fragaria x ananassa]